MSDLLQDVLLMDSLRGYWDSSNTAAYYNYLFASSNNTVGSAPLPHQRQELDPAFK